METLTTMQFAQELLRGAWPLLIAAIVLIAIPSLLIDMVEWILLKVILYASNATIDIYKGTRKVIKLLFRVNHVYILPRTRT